MPSVICLQGRLYGTCKRPPLYDFCGLWCGLSRLPASTLTLRFRPLVSLCVPVLLRHIPSEGGNARVCQFRHQPSHRDSQRDSNPHVQLLPEQVISLTLYLYYSTVSGKIQQASCTKIQEKNWVLCTSCTIRNFTPKKFR